MSTLKLLTATALLMTAGVESIVGDTSLLPNSNKFSINRLPAKKSTEIYLHHVIPDDQMATFFLRKGEPRTFFHLLQKDCPYLTFVLYPCTSNVAWHIAKASTGKVELDRLSGEAGDKLWSANSDEVMRYTVEYAHYGLYLLQVTPAEDTSVQLFATTQHRSGYPGLDIKPGKVHSLPSRTPGQLTLVWQPSTVDPNRLEYWVVLRRGSNVPCLCSVTQDSPDTIIRSSGDTRLTLRGLPHAITYSVDVFGRHNMTNVTFLLARGEASYHKPKPTPLRDSRPSAVDLQILEGRANFRYKVREKGDKLEWYVEVCGGGSLEAEVRLRKRLLLGPTRIKGLASLVLPGEPSLGARYVLRLTASDPEQLARITQVEVMGSMRGLPVVKMPEDKRVHEYRGLKRCRSVTLGWRPALDPTMLTYCIRATHTPPESDPCCLHEALNSLDFASLQCHDILYPHNSTIITQELTNLKPGRSYYVQVTVRSSKLKIAAYDYMQVYTKSLCS